jgi:hypothetical protein
LVFEFVLEDQLAAGERSVDVVGYTTPVEDGTERLERLACQVLALDGHPAVLPQGVESQCEQGGVVPAQYDVTVLDVVDGEVRLRDHSDHAVAGAFLREDIRHEGLGFSDNGVRAALAYRQRHYLGLEALDALLERIDSRAAPAIDSLGGVAGA